MNVDGKPMRTIWLENPETVRVIDQRRLPHEFVTLDLRTWQDGEVAIRDMAVRGAPLIGATAAWSLYLAARASTSEADLQAAAEGLLASRPTAVNLRWAVERMQAAWQGERDPAAILAIAEREAIAVCDEDVAICKAMGEHGLPLIRAIAERNDGAPVNIMTHCNAGWLAVVDYGTATAPIYCAHDASVPVHVWVDETRPRNQGANLTAWELGQHGVPHTVITDNAGGHLMQHGQVDILITGTDRTTRSGDVANKIGTYLKALAAHDNDIPFYVALPSPTIDWTISDGFDIPIEERSPDEVTHIQGRAPDGSVTTVQLTPDGSPAANPAFDVTPAKYVTGLLTERGICAPGELASLFPEGAASVISNQ